MDCLILPPSFVFSLYLHYQLLKCHDLYNSVLSRQKYFPSTVLYGYMSQQYPRIFSYITPILTDYLRIAIIDLRQLQPLSEFFIPYFRCKRSTSTKMEKSHFSKIHSSIHFIQIYTYMWYAL